MVYINGKKQPAIYFFSFTINDINIRSKKSLKIIKTKQKYSLTCVEVNLLYLTQSTLKSGHKRNNNH